MKIAPVIPRTNSANSFTSPAGVDAVEKIDVDWAEADAAPHDRAMAAEHRQMGENCFTRYAFRLVASGAIKICEGLWLSDARNRDRVVALCNFPRRVEKCICGSFCNNRSEAQRRLVERHRTAGWSHRLKLEIVIPPYCRTMQLPMKDR